MRSAEPTKFTEVQSYEQNGGDSGDRRGGGNGGGYRGLYDEPQKEPRQKAQAERDQGDQDPRHRAGQRGVYDAVNAHRRKLPFVRTAIFHATTPSADLDLPDRQNFLAVGGGAHGQREEEGHRPEAPDIHLEDEQDARQGAGDRRDARRKPDRRECGDALEKRVHAGDRVGAAHRGDDAGGGDRDRENPQDHDGQRFIDRALLHLAAEDDGVLVAAHDAIDGHKDDREGRALDAAARRAGRRADKHEQRGEDLGDVVHRLEREDVEARRAAAHRVEPRRAEPLPRPGKPSQGEGVVPLADGGKRHPHQDEGNGGDDDDAGVEQQFFGAPVLEQVVDDDEADAAHNDEQSHRADDDRVAHVAGQRYIRFRPPEDVEPGVAEGGDGGEHRDEDALRPELGHEHGRQQERARRLDGQRGDHDHLHELVDVRAGGRDRFLREVHPAQAELAADRDVEEGGQRHESQAADLDEREDDALPEGGPVGVGVVHDQPGHAGRGGRREQAVEKGGKGARTAGHGEHQQQRPHEDDRGKAQRDRARGEGEEPAPPDRLSIQISSPALS